MKKLFLFLAVSVCLFLPVQAVSFTLHNASLNGITLGIPSVMNPTLSPLSNSGVDLAVGQEIFFFYKGKQYLLLQVDETYEGRKVNVAQLIRQRKKELGL